MAPSRFFLFACLLSPLAGDLYAQGHSRWHQGFRIEVRNPVRSNDWVHLDLADLNGDGEPELLYADPYWHAGGARAETGRVMIFDGADGSTLFQHAGLQSYANYGWKAGFLDDLDGDGLPEIGTYRPFSTVENPVQCEVLRGTNLRPLPLFTPEMTHATLLADAGDVDADDVPDILVGDSLTSTGRRLYQARRRSCPERRREC